MRRFTYFEDPPLLQHTCSSDPEGYCVACDLGYDDEEDAS